MDMIKSRNETVHTYQEKILELEYDKIVINYYHYLVLFQQKMKTLL